MTYMNAARAAALMESRALRGWARAGTRVPKRTPVDLWAEWKRQEHCNASTRRAAA